MRSARLRDGFERAFGLPGRAWASTARLSRLGLACLVACAVVPVALGPGPFLAVGGWWPLALILTLVGLWVGIHPLNFRTAGIGVEIVLEGGLLALAVAAMGPAPGIAYWFVSTAVLEVVQRHNLALASVNLAIAGLSAGAAGAAAHAIGAEHLLSGALPALLGGAVIGAVYGIVETVGSDVGARYLGDDLRSPFPWSELGVGASVSGVLGAGMLLTAQRLGIVVAGVVLALPLALLARLVRVEEARREALTMHQHLVDALTTLASVDTREQAEQAVLDAAAVLSTAGSATITTSAPQESPTLRRYDLGPVFGASPDSAAPRRWLAVERYPIKIRTPRSDVASLEVLATAARAAGERIAERDRMNWLARHDQLTGLLNRNGWWQQTVLAGPVRDAAVLLLDLDGFKAVNDAYGHAVGDVVLRAVAREIADRVPDGATLARWGGDEFVVHLRPDVVVDLDTLGAHLVAGVQEAAARVTDLPVSASVGVATTVPGDAVDGIDLLARADSAMYDAKRAGKSTVRRRRQAVR